MRKRFAVLILALALFVLQSQSALACGGLVAPNGAVRLSRATTLVAWHDGIEHYMTSFRHEQNLYEPLIFKFFYQFCNLNI